MGDGGGSIHQLKGIIAEVLGCSVEDVKDSSDFFGLGADSVDAMKLATAAQKAGFDMSIATIYEKSVVSELANSCKNSFEQGDQRKKSKKPVETTESRSQALPEPGPDTASMATLLAHWELINQCIELGIQPDCIEEIYPAFTFQDEIMTLWLETIFEFENTAEVKARLMNAIERVYESDPMMRTRLVRQKSSGSLFQVVVKENVTWNQKPGPRSEFSIYNGRQPFSYGDPLTRLTIISNGDQDKAQIVWTLASHFYRIFRPTALTFSRTMLSQIALRGMLDINTVTMLKDDQLTKESSHRVRLKDRVERYLKDPAISTITFPPVKRLIERIQEDQEEGMAFWKPRLDGYRPVNYLPTPLQTPSQGLPKLYTIKTMQAPSNTTSGILPSIIYHVAWALCLAKHSKQSDIFFRSAGSGRQIPDFDDDLNDMSGMLISPVPFRVELSSQLPLKDFLRDVQKTVVVGLAHEHSAKLAMEDITEEFESKGHMPSTFNYSPLARDEMREMTFVTESEKEVKVAVITSPPHGWFYPAPPIYISMMPEGEGELKLSAVTQEAVVPKALASSLLDNLAEMIQKLSEGKVFTTTNYSARRTKKTTASPWDGMTIADFL